MPARVVKAHEVRRSEILACAERLFGAVGYEATTVSAIIEETEIAKGTFYHYFSSKEELLDSLVERLSARILDAIRPILDDDAPAADKLRRVHETAGAIKSIHAGPLLHVLYRPENILARHKMRESALQAVIPIYTRIVRQGIDQGLFDTGHPEESAEMLLRAWMGLADALAGLLVQAEDKPGNLEAIEHRLAVYEETAERVLGAARGSLRLGDASRRVLQGLRQGLADAAAAGSGHATGGRS